MTDQVEWRPGFESPYPTAITQVSKTGWRLIDHIVWHGHNRDGTPITVEVPPGRDTDFASTPPVLWTMFPPYGDYTAAAIAHDHMWRDLAKSGAMTYADADHHLREMLRASGVSWLRRWIMFSAVRWGSLLTRKGGHKGWLRDTPAVLGMSLVALPYVAIPAVVNAVHTLLFDLTEVLISAAIPSSKGTPPKETS